MQIVATLQYTRVIVQNIVVSFIWSYKALLMLNCRFVYFQLMCFTCLAMPFQQRRDWIKEFNYNRQLTLEITYFIVKYFNI